MRTAEVPCRFVPFCRFAEPLPAKPLSARPLTQHGSIFKPAQFRRKTWQLGGKRSLRPKGEGQGIMASAFSSDCDGMGMCMSDELMKTVNAARAAANPPREPLTTDPGVRLFEYGKARQGYWDSAEMLKQVIDVMDCFKAKHPNKQMLLELDNSGCHKKMASDAYISTHLNWGIGGAQQAPAPLKITTEAQLGRNDGRCVEVGQMFHFIFQAGAPPPYLHPNMVAEEYVGKAKG